MGAGHTQSRCASSPRLGHQQARPALLLTSRLPAVPGLQQVHRDMARGDWSCRRLNNRHVSKASRSCHASHSARLETDWRQARSTISAMGRRRGRAPDTQAQARAQAKARAHGWREPSRWCCCVSRGAGPCPVSQSAPMPQAGGVRLAGGKGERASIASSPPLRLTDAIQEAQGGDDLWLGT